MGTQRLGDLVLPVGLGVVGEDLPNDVDDGLVLEEVTVPAVIEEGEKGLDDEAVAGQSAIGAELHGVGDVTVPGALAAVGLQEEERDLGGVEGVKLEVGVGGDAVDVEAEGFGEGFAAGESFDDERGIRQCRLDLQQARVLGEQVGK